MLPLLRPLLRLWLAIRSLWMSLQPLRALPLLQAIWPLDSRNYSSLPPRHKARLLVEGLQSATLDCLRTQRHLISLDPRERHQRLRVLANSFVEGDWHPDRLTREDVMSVPADMIVAIVLHIANGRPVGGYESWLIEHYIHLQAPQTVPPMRKLQHRSRPHTPGRAYPYRDVQQLPE